MAGFGLRALIGQPLKRLPGAFKTKKVKFGLPLTAGVGGALAFGRDEAPQIQSSILPSLANMGSIAQLMSRGKTNTGEAASLASIMGDYSTQLGLNSPDIFELMKRPEVIALANQSIAGMQAPYRRQLRNQGIVGNQLADEIGATGEDFQRSSRNLIGGNQQARKSYLQDADKRRDSAASAMENLSDMMLGSVITTGSASGQRVDDQREASEDAIQAQQRASETGGGGSLTLEGLMSSNAQAQAAQTAGDVIRTREDSGRKQDELRGQIGDIASQRPGLLLEIAQLAAAQGGEQGRTNLSLFGALSDAGLLGGGADTGFNEALTAILADNTVIHEVTDKVKGSGASQKIPTYFRDIAEPQDIAELEAAYQQGGLPMMYGKAQEISAAHKSTIQKMEDERGIITKALDR